MRMAHSIIRRALSTNAKLLYIEANGMLSGKGRGGASNRRHHHRHETKKLDGVACAQQNNDDHGSSLVGSAAPAW